MASFEARENINQLLEIKDVLENGISKLKLILFRHGPKKEAAGEKDELADYFLIHVKEGLDKLEVDLSDNIHIISSLSDRAQKTEDVAVEHFKNTENVKKKPTNKKLGSIENLSEQLKLELDTLVQYQEKLEEKIKRGEDHKDYDNPYNKQRLKNKIDSIILENMFDGTLDNLGQELDLDETLNLSTDDFSKNLEDYTKGYLKHLGLLKSETGKSVSLNITHSYPIMSFLKNNLNFIEKEQIKSAKNMKGSEFLDKAGGCIDEAGSISLEYIQKDNKKLIKVKGKDFEGFIDYDL